MFSRHVTCGISQEKAAAVVLINPAELQFLTSWVFSKCTFYSFPPPMDIYTLPLPHPCARTPSGQTHSTRKDLRPFSGVLSHTEVCACHFTGSKAQLLWRLSEQTGFRVKVTPKQSNPKEELSGEHMVKPDQNFPS